MTKHTGVIIKAAGDTRQTRDNWTFSGCQPLLRAESLVECGGIWKLIYSLQRANGELAAASLESRLEERKKKCTSGHLWDL